jgi:small subunit ribosomal protein S6e
MVFKINISDKSGKTYKIELDSEALVEKELNQKINGKDIHPDLADYELIITGATDNAGFMASPDVEGIGLKKVLLSYGKGMHKKPKGDKKINRQPKGLRLRKTVRGKIISEATTQVNMKVEKQGVKKLSEIFPDQNKIEDAPKEEVKPEEKVEEKKE